MQRSTVQWNQQVSCKLLITCVPFWERFAPKVSAVSARSAFKLTQRHEPVVAADDAAL